MSERGAVMLTGAAGFIGSHVAEALLARGERVIGVDNFDSFYARSVKERNLAELRAGPHASRLVFTELDLGNVSALRLLMERERVGGVIHLAGKAGVRPSLADPIGYLHANVIATQAVMTAGTQAGVGRFVLASSSSVYGNATRVPFAEDDPAAEPISPYAATKRCCELLAHAHHAHHASAVACLRFFTVYGPRQRPDLAISLFMRKLLAGEALPVFGDGSMARDYTYAGDIAAGVLAAYDRVERFGFRIWNLGNNHPTRLDELIAALGRVSGIEPKLDRKPVPPGDVERTWADLTRSRAELGYDPRTDLAEGLSLQWAWMKASQPAMSAAAGTGGAGGAL
jgi:UDP-glucuronate 4-epimerase